VRRSRGLQAILTIALAALVGLALAAPVVAQDTGDRAGRESAMVTRGAAGGAGEETGARISSAGEDLDTRLDQIRTNPPAGLAGRVDRRTYVLGPGDVLQLDLWGRVARNVLLEVSPEGKVLLSGSGTIEVSGRTLEWARERVLSMVANTFRGVSADLRLVRVRTFRVYVVGSVEKPGSFEASPVMRASEVLAFARLLPDASRRGIELKHLDGSTSRVDLQLYENAGRQSMNPFLLDGDVVSVPRQTSEIEAGGAVMRPGRFEFVPGDSLSTLLALAGGLVPSTARDRLLMVRFDGPTQRDSLWLGVEDVVSGAVNPLLRDGDRLFAYFTPDFHQLPIVQVYGEVGRPGAYPIVVGRDHLSDLVRWAGGFGPRANRAAIHIVRPSEGGRDSDSEFDRLVRLSRSEMTESEYAVFQTKLAERRNSFRVDFDRVQAAGVAVDPLLRELDVVRVDPVVLSVRVEGQVRRPGMVEFTPGRKVNDYVQLAGGFTNRASRSSVRVSRSITGQVIPVKGLPSVQPGDFIWVGERRDLDAWQTFRDLLSVAGQVAVIWLAVKQ
jgi:polysaccharide biosynthesis/export protein